MTYLSLFSGIGGLDLGLDRAGMTCVAQVEIDPFCRAVLAKHWPAVPKFEDVRSFNASTIKAAEVVVGGFPCQDVSVAGKGAGLAGAQSALWFEMLRIICELRPRWVIAENVPALRNRGGDRCLEGLEGLGYACWPVVVGVDDVGGPHRRKRVFLIARTAGTDGGCQRCAACMADAECARLEGLWPYARAAQIAQLGHVRLRWPAGPGQPQHEWEEPRLLQLPLGGAVDGICARLLRAAHKHALRAYGNAVCPAVAEVIGRAVMRADAELRNTY